MTFQLLAYESVLQFAPPASWPVLKALHEEANDCTHYAHALLRLVPALAVVIRIECQANQVKIMCSDSLRWLAGWLFERATSTFKSLSQHEPEPPQTLPDTDWREVSSFLTSLAQSDLHITDRHVLWEAGYTSASKVPLSAA